MTISIVLPHRDDYPHFKNGKARIPILLAIITVITQQAFPSAVSSQYAHTLGFKYLVAHPNRKRRRRHPFLAKALADSKKKE